LVKSLISATICDCFGYFRTMKDNKKEEEKEVPGYEDQLTRNPRCSLRAERQRPIEPHLLGVGSASAAAVETMLADGSPLNEVLRDEPAGTTEDCAASASEEEKHEEQEEGGGDYKAQANPRPDGSPPTRWKCSNDGTSRCLCR
jgi:hypothetical protein